jgi:hypothetical protein
MNEIAWATVFGGLLLFSLTFSLLAQGALRYLRKWLLSPTIFMEGIQDVIRSGKRARTENQKDIVVNFLEVLAHFSITTSYIIFVFLFSAIGISSVISSLVLPVGSSSSVNLPFIEGAILLGALIALMTRIFSLQISDALIKGVFFQGATTVATFAMLFLMQPFAFYDAYLTPSLRATMELWTNGFLPTTFIVFGIVFTLMEAVAFFRSPPISLGLFRERRESLETGVQCLLKDQIEDTVKAILDSCKEIKTIRWATAGGFEDLEKDIFDTIDKQKNKPDCIKFITSQTTFENWQKNRKASRMIPYTRVSMDIGFVRFMIVNNEVLIEVLPMPEGDSSNTGIVVRHPLVVQEHILAFDNWYDSLSGPSQS